MRKERSRVGKDTELKHSASLIKEGNVKAKKTVKTEEQ